MTNPEKPADDVPSTDLAQPAGGGETPHIRLDPGRLQTLTPRQRQILVQVILGVPTTEVAREFNIARKTVYSHLVKITKKLGTRNRTIMALYVEHGGFLRVSAE